MRKGVFFYITRSRFLIVLIIVCGLLRICVFCLFIVTRCSVLLDGLTDIEVDFRLLDIVKPTFKSVWLPRWSQSVAKVD